MMRLAALLMTSMIQSSPTPTKTRKNDMEVENERLEHHAPPSGGRSLATCPSLGTFFKHGITARQV